MHGKAYKTVGLLERLEIETEIPIRTEEKKLSAGYTTLGVRLLSLSSHSTKGSMKLVWGRDLPSFLVLKQIP
jgi:hypothetical protein